jgi:hypothetical protein
VAPLEDDHHEAGVLRELPRRRRRCVVARYPGAFLSLRGSLDHFTANESDFLNRPSGLPRESVIGGASHIFNVFEETGHPARVLGLTSDWLQRTL